MIFSRPMNTITDTLLYVQCVGIVYVYYYINNIIYQFERIISSIDICIIYRRFTACTVKMARATLVWIFYEHAAFLTFVDPAREGRSLDGKGKKIYIWRCYWVIAVKKKKKKRSATDAGCSRCRWTYI